MAKVTISLADDLLSRIDAKASEMYISRSAYIATALTQKMQADDAMTMLPELSKVLKDAMKMQADKEHMPYMDSTRLGAEAEEARAELEA